MAKFKPGIPDNFSLDVEPVRDLGDYLDEPSPMPQRKPKVQAADREGGRGTVVEGETAPVASVPAGPVVPAMPARARSVSPAVPHEAAVPPPVVEAPPILLREERVIPQALPHATVSPGIPERPPAMDEDRLPRPKAPRREVSMTPETLRMSDELLELLRSGSGQRDTKANELFHALVLLVHEAMDEIDPHVLPKRGRWGTPTARAYPLELKNAFLRALLRRHGVESAASATG